MEWRKNSHTGENGIGESKWNLKLELNWMRIGSKNLWKFVNTIFFIFILSFDARLFARTQVRCVCVCRQTVISHIEQWTASEVHNKQSYGMKIKKRKTKLKQKSNIIAFVARDGCAKREKTTITAARRRCGRQNHATATVTAAAAAAIWPNSIFLLLLTRRLHGCRLASMAKCFRYSQTECAAAKQQTRHREQSRVIFWLILSPVYRLCFRPEFSVCARARVVVDSCVPFFISFYTNFCEMLTMPMQNRFASPDNSIRYNTIYVYMFEPSSSFHSTTVAAAAAATDLYSIWKCVENWKNTCALSNDCEVWTWSQFYAYTEFWISQKLPVLSIVEQSNHE